MPVGFELKDGSGNVVLDGTTRVAKIFGIVQITGTNGSTSDSKLSTYTAAPYNCTPVWFWVGSNFGPEDWMPNITISGSTIAWNYGTVPPLYNTAKGRVFYGVY